MFHMAGTAAAPGWAGHAGAPGLQVCMGRRCFQHPNKICNAIALAPKAAAGAVPAHQTAHITAIMCRIVDSARRGRGWARARSGAPRGSGASASGKPRAGGARQPPCHQAEARS